MPRIDRLGLLLACLLAGAAFAQADVRLEVTESFSRPGDDPDDSTVIIGMIENTGSVRVSLVRVDAVITSDGRTLTDFTYADRFVLLPGERSPFKLYLNDGLVVDGYELSLSAMPAIFLPDRRVDVGFWHVAEGPLGALKLEGVVRNTGSRPARWVDVIVAGYDASGRLAAVASSPVDEDVLEPGELSAFDVYFFRSRAPIESYDLWAVTLELFPF